MELLRGLKLLNLLWSFKESQNVNPFKEAKNCESFEEAQRRLKDLFEPAQRACKACKELKAFRVLEISKLWTKASQKLKD